MSCKTIRIIYRPCFKKNYKKQQHFVYSQASENATTTFNSKTPKSSNPENACNEYLSCNWCPMAIPCHKEPINTKHGWPKVVFLRINAGILNHWETNAWEQENEAHILAEHLAPT